MQHFSHYAGKFMCDWLLLLLLLFKCFSVIKFLTHSIVYKRLIDVLLVILPSSHLLYESCFVVLQVDRSLQRVTERCRHCRRLSVGSDGSVSEVNDRRPLPTRSRKSTTDFDDRRLEVAPDGTRIRQRRTREGPRQTETGEYSLVSHNVQEKLEK